MYYRKGATGMGLAYQALPSRYQTTRGQYNSGGSGVTTVQKKRRKAVGRYNSFAKRVLATEAAHHSTTSDTSCNQAMLHNAIYTFGPTQTIVQGTNNTQRAGDEVYLCALKVSATIVTDTAAGAFSYRVMVGYSGEEYAAASGFVSGLTLANLFLPNTGGANATTAIVNPKTFTVVDDRMVDINSLITATADLKTLAYTCSLNTKFPYKASGSVYGKTRNLYLVVIGFKAGGSGATAVGTALFNTDLIFKQI